MLLLLTACREDPTTNGADAPVSGGSACEPGTANEDIFQNVWEVLAEEYPYFTYKGVDWAALGLACQEQLCSSTSYMALVDDGLGCLLTPLADDHVSVRDRDGYWHDYPWNDPASNVDADLVDGFLDPGSAEATEHTLAGTLAGGRVAYIRVDTWDNTLVSSEDVAALGDGLRGRIGVVVDMRENYGGSPVLPQALAGQFTSDSDTPYAFLSTRSEQDGNVATSEFAPLEPLTLYPTFIAEEVFAGPVAVLIGPNCVSACESFIAMMKSLVPAARTFGAGTRGAGSYANSVTLADGETQLFYSQEAVLKNDATYIEWVGFQPDVEVEFLGSGTDEVLAAALAWFEEGASGELP